MNSGKPSPKVLLLEPPQGIVDDVALSVTLALQTLFKTNAILDDYSIEETCSVRGDITGVMAMVQDSNEGSFIISFPKETVFALLETALAKRFTEVNSFVESAVGELTNVIFGLIKNQLGTHGFDFKMGVPSLIGDEDHLAVSPEEGTTLVIPFVSDAGYFHVMLTRRPRPASVKAA